MAKANTKTKIFQIPGIAHHLSSGWWVAIGCTGAIFVSGFPLVGDFAFGIMSLALIYQLDQLFKGK